MPDLFRRLLHATFLVTIVASLWTLADAQRPPEWAPVYQSKGTGFIPTSEAAQEVASTDADPA
jgi:hypothetical protein